MGDLTLFLKQNKIERENQKYAATKSILDESGKPVEWEFRPLTTEEVENIRTDNTKRIPVVGKTGQYQQKVDSKNIIRQMICESCVYPDLRNAELLNSYGVKTPEEVVVLIIDNPGEYDDLAAYIQKMNGYMLDEKVEEAKN